MVSDQRYDMGCITVVKAGDIRFENERPDEFQKPRDGSRPVCPSISRPIWLSPEKIRPTQRISGPLSPELAELYVVDQPFVA